MKQPEQVTPKKLPALLGVPDPRRVTPNNSGTGLHTLWAQSEVVERSPQAFHTVLEMLRTRFRVASVMVLVVQNDAVVINMRAGADPAELDCTSALNSCRRQPDHMLVIEEATELHDVAAGSRCVRFYAGAPLLVNASDAAVGVLCLIDTKRRGFSRADRILLEAFAKTLSAMLLMPQDAAAARTIALSAGKSVLLLNDSQMVEAVNTRFTKLTNLGADDLLTIGIDELLCLDRPNSGALLISHALLAEIPAQGTTRCHTKDGNTLPVQVFVIPLRDSHGQVVTTMLLIAPLFSGPIEDFLLSLRSSERNQLLSIHIAGLWSVDNTGLIGKLSGAPVAYLDLSSQASLKGKRLECAGIFDAAQTDWSAFYKSIAEGSPPDEVECCVTHNGHSQWYSMVGFRQYDARGHAIGYHGSFRDITRRKLKANALVKATQRQQLILKGINDGTWDLDMETGEYYLSSRWWQMMGRDPASHLPTPEIWMQFIHPDDSLAVRNTFNDAVSQGKDSYQAEFRMLHQNGHYFPVLGRGHILRNAQGRAIRTSGANQDLTAQLQAQAQIRLLQSCVESLQDVVLITHASPIKIPGPIIAYVNPAFERFTGYSSEEVIGKTPRLLQGPQTCRQTLDKITTAMQSWQAVRCELANYKKNGELFWVELEIIPVKADGGQWFTHWIGVQRDITERRHAEQVLLTTTQRLNLALEGSDLGLWTSDFERDEGYQDARWQKMLGLPEVDVTTTAQAWLKLVHPDDNQRVLDEPTEASGLSGSFEKEFRMRHADGRWVWIQRRGKVIRRDATGRPLVLAGTHLDVTTAVQARQLSERLNTQLSRCLELLNVGVLVQRHGVIKFTNSALIKMFGATTGDDGVGKKFSDGLLPEDVKLAAWRQQQLMAGATLPSAWLNCVHRDGRVFKALTNSIVIEWEGERHILSTMTLPSKAALIQENAEKTRLDFEGLLANQIEKEQVHIAHELHDSLGSQLAGVSLQAAGLKALGSGSELQEKAIDQLLENIKIAAEMTRSLARGLAPVDAWPGAIGYALKKLCHDFSLTKDLQCEFEVDGDMDAVSAQTATHLYRIAQEAITNALRHGAAQRIHIRLGRSGADYALTIVDDGRGFEVRSVLNEPRKGIGLSSMYARAHAIGAQIRLEQLDPRGFRVSVDWSQS